MKELLARKNAQVLALEAAKRAGGSRRAIDDLASDVAVLEGQLARLFASAGRRDDAAISLISAASCLDDARRGAESRRLLERARYFAEGNRLRAWIA